MSKPFLFEIFQFIHSIANISSICFVGSVVLNLSLPCPFSIILFWAHAQGHDTFTDLKVFKLQKDPCWLISSRYIWGTGRKVNATALYILILWLETTRTINSTGSFQWTKYQTGFHPSVNFAHNKQSSTDKRVVLAVDGHPRKRLCLSRMNPWHSLK